MCGHGGGVLAPITNTVKTIANDVTTVFTNPGKANIGQFIDVGTAGLYSPVITDIKAGEKVGGIKGVLVGVEGAVVQTAGAYGAAALIGSAGAASATAPIGGPVLGAGAGAPSAPIIGAEAPALPDVAADLAPANYIEPTASTSGVLGGASDASVAIDASQAGLNAPAIGTNGVGGSSLAQDFTAGAAILSALRQFPGLNLGLGGSTLAGGPSGGGNGPNTGSGGKSGGGSGGGGVTIAGGNLTSSPNLILFGILAVAGYFLLRGKLA